MQNIMTTNEVIMAATQKCLSVRKKCLSFLKSLDLFTNVLAVESGLKPCLLYDANSANSEQVQCYLRSLQSSQIISKSLFTLDLSGNTLIVNKESALLHVNEILSCSSVGVIDVCHSLKSPVLYDSSRGEFKNMMKKLILIIQGFEHDNPEPLFVGELCKEWNLCTVFGALLGYPVTYWFDQNKSFENCLSMTPLMINTVSAVWKTDAFSHTSCLYSFSIPVDLHQKLPSILKLWNNHLQEQFDKQHVFTDLTISESTVTLSSVCL
ncbi:unnamed protein product [Knipowitschia caucasica]